MRITEEFLNSLAPVEISYIMASINKLSYDKIKHEITNYENLNPKIERCPHCGSVHFVRNGYNPKEKTKIPVQRLPQRIYGNYRNNVFALIDNIRYLGSAHSWRIKWINTRTTICSYRADSNNMLQYEA